MESIKEKSEEQLKEIFGLVDQIDPDNVHCDNITVRAGGKILKFELVSEETLSIEDEVRNEFKEKMKNKIDIIRENVNKKISEMSDFVSRIKNDYDKKERALREKERKMVSMPEVNIRHAEQGLSVVKGRESGELYWLVRGIYWPKTVDGKQIEPRYSKKLMTPVIFVIRTHGDRIVEVSTRQPIGLGFFEHYHQNQPDCWGNWKYPKTWRKPEDIITIARQAEAVLENINTLSIANQSPRGLPRKSTVMSHIVKETTDKRKMNMGILNQSVRRSGVTPDIRSNDDNVWST